MNKETPDEMMKLEDLVGKRIIGAKFADTFDGGLVLVIEVPNSNDTMTLTITERMQAGELDVRLSGLKLYSDAEINDE